MSKKPTPVQPAKPVASEPEQWAEDRCPQELLPELDSFVDILRRQSAFDFSGYKPSTLSRRIRQRMGLARIDKVADYCTQITEHKEERDALCQDLLINVTEFFRDPAVFSHLADELFPDLLRGRDPGDDLRLWSAGCATGEEAYTLAMLALDAAGRFGFNGNVKVFATDIHKAALETASQGIYDDDAVRHIPDALLRRFFQREDNFWRVDSALRRHVVFARHNLLVDPPFTRIDLVCCRNLLIYLKPETQLKALAQIHFALKPQGMLLLGASETAGVYEPLAFTTIDRSHKLFRRKPAQLPRNFDPMSGRAQPVLPAGSHDIAGEVCGSPAVLEAELMATRERLQEMVVELQNSHERIDLANEELTASNEELQSTNEELQSVNEDLYTLNAELEKKNSDLDHLNRDYDHLLASAEIGTVFLDADLHVRRFSSSISTHLSLRKQDQGRPITEIAYNLGDPQRFFSDLRRVAESAGRVEREIALAGNQWLLERMLPFRGEGGVQDGVVLTYTNISEVKAAQTRADELAAERTHLQNILDALPDGVYIVNQHHDIEYINPTLENEFGPPGNRKCYEYFHGRNSECDWCKNAEVHAGRSVHWEWTSPHGRTYDLFDMPFRNADGSVSKLEIFHDITPIKESIEQLAEASTLAHVGHWEWNLVDQSLRWGRETFRIFGHEPDHCEPTYALFIDTLHEDDRARVEGLIATSIDARQPYLAEFRFHRADGELRIGRATGHLELGTNGQPLKLSGAMQDITELRQTENALHESEARFAVAFRAAPHAASIARVRDGLIIEANDKYLSCFGWPREEMIGKTSLELGLWPDIKDRDAWWQNFGQQGTMLNYEALWCDRNGRLRHVSIASEQIEINGEAHALCFIEDITERKEVEARIEYLAHHDTLTELPNRVLFRDRFMLATAWAERTDKRIGLLFLDLDHFKSINDTLGHPAGDTLLRLVADRLRDSVRDTDTISRLGGDEFLIALTDVQDTQDITRICNKILDMLAQPFELEGRELTNTLSIGISVWPDDGRDFDTLLKKADTALYQAKNAGRNTSRFYTEQMNVDTLERLQTKAALRRALENSEFELHYQPQINLATKQVVGIEALLRWNRPSAEGAEMVPPAKFIPSAEESGLIVPIGNWVLNEACTQAARWQAAGLPEMTMAVNLSAVQFHRGNLEESVLRALGNSGIDPARLELELTESLLLEDAEAVLSAIRCLKGLGVQLSIDDFGTGYSSLAYLKRFAVDKLKIDQSFVRDIASDPDDAAIVRAIVSMAHTLKLRVIAEGVESEEIGRFLGIYRCDEAQGYYYARPMPAAAFPDWLHAWQNNQAGPA